MLRRYRERVASRPWLLLVRWRSRWDFYRTGLRGRARYYTAIVGLALGVLGLAYIPLEASSGMIVAVVGILLSVASLIPEWIVARRGRVIVEQVHGYRTRVRDVGDAELVRHPTSRFELMVVPTDVEAALAATRATCSYQRTGGRPLPDKVRRFAFDILSERVLAKTVFNGQIVRQDTDLTAATLRADANVQLSRTDYYSLMCSNYMTDWLIRDRESRAVRFDGSSLIVAGDDRLLSLAESGLANGIGVSTLGITADFRVVLVGQHRLAQSSPDLFAPAGSGSMDLHDIKAARSGGKEELKVVVARAMRRELCEECNIKPSQLGLTEVLGFFRWLNKGGKPEYTGITQISLTAEELRHRAVRIVETHYVRQVEPNCQVDIRKLRERPDSLSCLPQSIREKTSVPLFMCLRSVGRALRRDDPLGQRLERMVRPTSD